MKPSLGKLLSVLLALALIFGAGAAAVPRGFASPLELKASAASADKLRYEIDNDGKVTVTGCDESAAGELVIPATIEGKPVTSIDCNAFENCTSLTSVTIPDGVTDIGYYAFEGCTSLTSVTIPDGVTSIGNNAFSDCTSLTSVTIPDGVTSIGNDAFYGCTSLTSVTIPDGVARIGYKAFVNTGIYKDAGNWENGVLYIGNHIIDAKSNVVSGDYTIKAGTKTIADYAFVDCYSLTSVTIPDGVTSISCDAFAGCLCLTSIIIPDGVTGIGDDAFYGCSSLTSVKIPDGVTSIGNDAFQKCTSLTAITVGKNNPSYCDIDGVLFSKDKTILIQYPAGKTATKYTIPDGVTEIDYDAFEGCTSLTSVKIPDGVTSIGYKAFYGCSGLTSVKIPDGVTSIGNDAFQKCTSLTGVKIGNGVTEICNAAFEDCTSLTAITVGKKNPGYCDIDGVLFNKDKTILIQYPIGNARTTYTIPDGVTSIGYCAFEGCESLTSVTIPDSVTSISDGAFWGCSSLTSVTIGNGVTEIEDDAFSDCSALADVYYGGSESDWGNITISDENDPLLNANVHYNSSVFGKDKNAKKSESSYGGERGERKLKLGTGAQIALIAVLIVVVAAIPIVVRTKKKAGRSTRP